MATKKELFENVSKEIGEACTEFNVPEDVTEELLNIVAKHLKPRQGGATINVDEVTQKDKKGNIISLQCSVSGVFLPATKEYFYEDKTGRGVVGLRRLSRKAESIRKAHLKAIAAKEKAIMDDVLSGAVTADKANDLIAEIKKEKPDYSAVAE